MGFAALLLVAQHGSPAWAQEKDSPSAEIAARAFVVTDTEGKTRGVLTSEPLGEGQASVTHLSIFDKRGRRRASLFVDNQNHIKGIVLFDEKGVCAMLAHGDLGSHSRVAMLDKNAQERVELQCQENDDDETSSISVIGSNGKSLVGIAAINNKVFMETYNERGACLTSDP